MSASCSGVRLRVDRAVAVDEHAVGEAHEEDARDDRHALARPDDLERRAGSCRRSCAPRPTPSRPPCPSRPSSCRSSSGRRRGRARAPRSCPCACAARSSGRRTPRGAASASGSTTSTPSRSTPSAAAACTSSGSPRIVRSTTPRRSRISAARRIRSSSPSGRTMWRAVGPRALDQLVLEHDRRHPRGPLERDPLGRARRCRRSRRTAERRRDLPLVLRAEPAADGLHRRRRLVRQRAAPRAPGTARSRAGGATVSPSA